MKRSKYLTTGSQVKQGVDEKDKVATENNYMGMELLISNRHPHKEALRLLEQGDHKRVWVETEKGEIYWYTTKTTT